MSPAQTSSHSLRSLVATTSELVLARFLKLSGAQLLTGNKNATGKDCVRAEGPGVSTSSSTGVCVLNIMGEACPEVQHEAGSGWTAFLTFWSTLNRKSCTTFLHTFMSHFLDRLHGEKREKHMTYFILDMYFI